MFRLASFLIALWLSSAAAQPGVFSTFKQVASGLKNQVTNEVQAGLDPVGQTLSYIGDGLCNHVKPIAGVAYANYNKEPDMSKLTLTWMTKAKTIIYNLMEAPEEIPKERWFDPQLPLRIYLHGFTDNPTKNSFQTMNDAFFAQEASKGQSNILALDASSLIASFYLRSSTMVRFIGQKLGQTFVAMTDAGMDPQNIHLIGHSLGSHIAGFAGQMFLNQTGSLLGRISSLDPAGPCFGQLDSTLRLSKDDANFVDVIHTDAGVYGINENVGHVDFWPNSGAKQPNCLFQTCSHSRAWELYSESVLTPQAFLAVKCNSYYEFRNGDCDYNDTSVMGYGTSPETRGTYYLMTNDEEPFALGALGLTYKDRAVLGLISNAVKDTLFLG